MALALTSQCDYINPIDLCNKLNIYIVPEMVPITSLYPLLNTLTLGLGSARVPNVTFPHEWVLARAFPQHSPRGMECKQVLPSLHSYAN